MSTTVLSANSQVIALFEALPSADDRVKLADLIDERCHCWNDE